jgi:hypothetical protein
MICTVFTAICIEAVECYSRYLTWSAVAWVSHNNPKWKGRMSFFGPQRAQKWCDASTSVNNAWHLPHMQVPAIQSSRWCTSRGKTLGRRQLDGKDQPERSSLFVHRKSGGPPCSSYTCKGSHMWINDYLLGLRSDAIYFHPFIFSRSMYKWARS